MIMVPEVQIAIIGGIGVFLNCLTVIIVALIQLRASARNHEAISVVSGNVARIEVATNSMQDKLVASTQLAGEAKGRSDLRSEQNSEAKGRADERAENAK